MSSERKYKAKIKEWGFEKNIGLSDMMVISAKAAKRAREGKDTLILIGEVPMDPRRLETFKKRKVVKESMPESPSAGKSLWYSHKIYIDLVCTL